jgi:hypothetical protein
MLRGGVDRRGQARADVDVILRERSDVTWGIIVVEEFFMLEAFDGEERGTVKGPGCVDYFEDVLAVSFRWWRIAVC